MAEVRIEYVLPEELVNRSFGLGNQMPVLKSLAAYAYCFNEERPHQAPDNRTRGDVFSNENR